ncbi:hypothetical protein MCOR02_007132 [Pyricularia oryzae]|uniref:EF-hand domain-containing protein n=1 Tax=Pyricularia oryzae TaxID=318829 RepID=A0A4P7NQX7_PYROR|nr:hypothetical protein MCOR02_007132 [Pyricularia oryzae]KAI6302872.1 hypothetical protein MCOR34_008895 [Pyricularia oryzae]KAI6468184.1 hypothetical protein MCOR17_004185 [Pyricularia oryzae]KAI6512221.1 hypothetical protein MCOR13_000034 [Pyricularia oryzae]KAI6577909.1 hypothetical protein MCOR04_006564 [Pyricularia oryzae]
MAAPTSPRNPQRMGFMPINGGRGSEEEADIPLSTIRTASSTGARKPNQAIETNMMASEKTPGIGPGRRRLKNGLADQGRRGTGGTDDVALNAMGRLYYKIIGFSVVTRYLVYIVPVGLLLLIPIIVLIATGNIDDDKIRLGGNEGPALYRLFVWIMASWLGLWAGKIVAHLLPPIFMFFCGVVSSGTRKYATVIRALEIPLSLFFWALVSWLLFRFLFPDGPPLDSIQWITVMKKILGALFVSSAVFLGEKTIVQLISITYHQRSFANRIKDSKREVYLLGLLYDASRTLFPMYCPEFIEEDSIINDSLDVMLKKVKGSGSATPMRLIGNVGANVGRLGDKITSVFGNVASEITGKQVFNPNSSHSICVEALEKVKTSEALARRIWMSFVVEGSDSLSQEDIEEVLGPEHKEDAEECFAAIDADQNGDISLDEMVRKVVEIGIERKAIANSMKDISQALAVFDDILLFIVALIVVFIFLAFFQSTFITTLATAGTALLSLSFVFAVTTQEFLGSCIFLFVKHPFDVGDRVDITGPEKEQLIVERISLLYTVFTRIDKMQVVQVPNIVLNNLWIENVTRSKAMKETIDVNVSYDTTFEDIELLRMEMEKFVRHPDNARDFMPDFSISVGSVGDLDKMTLKVTIKHKSNWHNDAVRATRRSKFMCALALALKRVPIHGPGGGGEPLGGPTNPTYSVAVSDGFASDARDKANKAKDSARMVPTKTLSRSGSSASQKSRREKESANELNSPVDVARQAAAGYGNRDGDMLDDMSPVDRQRTNDLANLRKDMITKNQSQRGRRQAGQTLPPQSLGETGPRLTLTREESNPGNPSRSPRFDVESQTGGLSPGMGSPGFGTPAAGGGNSTFAGNPYYSSTATTLGGAQAQQGYSVFPRPAGSSSPPSTSTNFAGLQAPTHPLQSAPTTGSRARGQSVSSTRDLTAQRPPQQQGGPGGRL